MTERAAQMARSSPDRIFFPAMVLTIMTFVVVGVADSDHFMLFAKASALGIFVHLHGVVFSPWLLLFFMQTLLI